MENSHDPRPFPALDPYANQTNLTSLQARARRFCSPDRVSGGYTDCSSADTREAALALSWRPRCSGGAAGDALRRNRLQPCNGSHVAGCTCTPTATQHLEQQLHERHRRLGGCLRGHHEAASSFRMRQSERWAMLRSMLATVL